ncbi:MAG: hypothetical protein J6A92_03265 [Lachnospiraceae bacterium]|nr:hypothetical protein [Lachnospiraceae bacterium]
MSEFSENFKKIKDKRNLTCAEIIERMESENFEIYHWINGNRIPKNWKQLEDVILKLELTEDEYRNLKTVYEKERLGEREYSNHKKIMEIFETLQQRRMEYHSKLNGMHGEGGHPAIWPDFVKLNNRMEILGWIQNVLDYLLTQKEKKIYVKLGTIHAEVLMLLKMLCSKTEDCYIEEIVHVFSEEKDRDVYNLGVLKDVIELWIQKNTLHVYWVEDKNEEQGLEENWILSNDFVIQYDAEFSHGMFSADGKWIGFVRENFERLKNVSESLATKACEVMGSNVGYEKADMTGYTMEYMPCIGNGLTEAILEQHIYPHIPGRNALIQEILNTHLLKNKNQKFKWYSFFSREGLIEFMETGRIDTFPYEVYKRPELPVRCEMLENAMNSCRDGRFSYFMVKDKEFPSMKNLYIEQMVGSMEKLELGLCLKDGVKEQLRIKNAGIQKQFLNFCSYLEEGGYVYTQNETLAYMKQILQEYKK